MLAYKENRKLDSNKLVIELPESFVGNYVEVIVIEQNDNYYTDLIKHQKFDFGLKPIKIGLSNPDMLFSREDLYD